MSTVDVTYDDLGNIVSKSDVGDYSYEDDNTTSCATSPSGAAGPHAVSKIFETGTTNVLATYCYDANGQMLSGERVVPGGDWREFTWSPFGKPVSIVRTNGTALATSTLAYGPERDRYKRVDTVGTSVTETLYVGGKAYEVIDRDGVVEHKLYIGSTLVITDYASTTEHGFLLRDHLGSVDTITDLTGAVIERTSFDPWGKRREDDWSAMPEASGYFSASTTRGFTGHEQLDPVALVHMNGRVYDPDIGRFASPDILIQDRLNLQSWNAYSYVHNNPLSYTDPSGFVTDPVPIPPLRPSTPPIDNGPTTPEDPSVATITLDPETGQPESVSLSGDDTSYDCVDCTLSSSPSPTDSAVSYADTAAGPAAVLGVGNGLALTVPIEPNLPWLGQADAVAINRGDERVASYGGDDFLAGAAFQIAAAAEGVFTPPDLWPDLGRLLGGRALGGLLSPVGWLTGAFLMATTTETAAERQSELWWVARAGIGGANNFRNGTRMGPNGFGFSIQVRPPLQPDELARAAGWPNNQYVVSTVQALEGIEGVTVNFPTPGAGPNHGTVNIDQPVREGIFGEIADRFSSPFPNSDPVRRR